jgi:neurotransmitter:Na+ symporter, NSS family
VAHGTEGHGGAGGSAGREVWGTRLGFVLAAVGSAVGLGNMWRFSYVASEGGGAAFLLLYVVLITLIGVPLMLAEFSVGRRTHLSPIGAIRQVAGSRWVPLGLLFVVTGFVVLSYYAVIAGWTVRYSVDGIRGGFAGDPGAYFDSISTGGGAIAYHLLFMAVTIGIVMKGIQRGIERAALVLMPALFLILLGLAVWAATLPGAREGYAFYLQPSLQDLMDPAVLTGAAGQAFFSLSLGMGAMLTFASYLSRDSDLNQEAVTVSLSDFLVAFIAGLVVFPVVAALGLQDQVGESTVGALFISLPGAFESMGGIGRLVGVFFFVALAVGALTSALSLLEVVTASIIDEFRIPRKKAALGLGLSITAVGVIPALSLDALGLMDAIAGEFFLVLGALGMVLVVGWVMPDPAGELRRGASPRFARFVPAVMVLIRYVLPLVIGVVLWFATLGLIENLRAFFGG